MKSPRTGLSLAITAALWLAAGPDVIGQDTLAHAKDLYAQAAYEEALVLLDRMHKTASEEEAAEIAGYQVLCFLALGRSDEARVAIEGLVKAHPLYRLSEAIASPRTRELFEEVRRGLLPRLVQESYDRAKAAYDRKEPQLAVTEFDRVLVLLNEPGVSELAGMADLRRLAVGFRDLSLAAAPTEPAAPEPTPAKGLDPVAPLPPPTSTTESATVVPPVSVSRILPPWRPRNPIEAIREYLGIIAVDIDEKGDVASALMEKSVHPEYDAVLLKTARTWKFRPATKNGVPVRYRMAIEVHLRPSGT